jgi:integrase
LGLLQKAFLS